MHLWGKCNCFCRFHKKIRFDADIYISRRVLKTPGVETEFKADIYISRRVSKTPGVETEFKADIYISRRVSKIPGVETASEFRNTRNILCLLNAWIKSA